MEAAMKLITIARPIAIAAALLIAAPAALAGQVRLVSTDGLIDFTGELEDFDGEKYVLKTNIGALTIPANEVTCEGDDCPESNLIASQFRIVGDRTVLRFAIPELLDAYSLTVDTDITRGQSASGELLFKLLSYDGDPVVDLSLGEADAATAFGELAAGTATMAVTTRPITEAEAEALAGGGRRAVDALGLEQVVGLDGLVAIVGSEVPGENISVENLARIYAGEVTNWSELGGPDLAISAFAREAGSEVRAMLDRLVMEPGERAVGGNVISVDSNEGVASAVATFPNSIGVTSYGSRPDARTLAVLDACGSPVEPSLFAIKSEAYPLTSPIYLYVAPGSVPVHARGLIDFSLSGIGQQVLKNVGFVDLLPEPAPEDGADPLEFAALAEAGGSRAALRELRGLADGARRLSTAFELRGEGARIDVRTRAGLVSLAQYIRAGRLDGQELVFAGFASAGDDAADTRRRSLSASRLLLAELFRANPDIEEQITVGFRMEGFGDVLQKGCTVSGDAGNLRVEVWVRPLAGG